MSADWVTAIATSVTAIVIAASAIAALMQLRHMRTGNQIAAYNECLEKLESPEFRQALAFIRTELAGRIADPRTLEDIVASRTSSEYFTARLVANLFESMGLFVRLRMMDERIACELWSGIVLSAWNPMRPLIREMRKRYGPSIWINFEYMAFVSKAFAERFPDGAFPSSVPRMPLDEPADAS